MYKKCQRNQNFKKLKEKHLRIPKENSKCRENCLEKKFKLGKY